MSSVMIGKKVPDIKLDATSDKSIKFLTLLAKTSFYIFRHL